MASVSQCTTVLRWCQCHNHCMLRYLTYCGAGEYLQAEAVALLAVPTSVTLELWMSNPNPYPGRHHAAPRTNPVLVLNHRSRKAKNLQYTDVHQQQVPPLRVMMAGVSSSIQIPRLACASFEGPITEGIDCLWSV